MAQGSRPMNDPEPTRAMDRPAQAGTKRSMGRDEEPDLGRLPSRHAPIFEMLQREMKQREAGAGDDGAAQSPEDIPDISRELTILEGVAHAVETRAAQLVARLGPVLTDADAPLLVGREATGEKRHGGMAPASPLSKRVNEVYLRMSAVEQVLTVAESRLGV